MIALIYVVGDGAGHYYGADGNLDGYEIMVAIMVTIVTVFNVFNV